MYFLITSSFNSHIEAFGLVYTLLHYTTTNSQHTMKNLVLKKNRVFSSLVLRKNQIKNKMIVQHKLKLHTARDKY